MSATPLLERLERVKQTGQDRWIAKCPAHGDKSPSLSIRELDDGRVLLHCFAGCGALDVLDAVGLEWGALFPPNARVADSSAVRSRIPARDLLEILEHEITVACLILADAVDGRTVNEDQWQRLAQCAARIGRARHG